VLADELEVDAGYELALAAALDGRLSAAVVPDRGSADALLDSTGKEGGRALIALDHAASSGSQLHPPGPDAEPIAERVRGPARALALAHALLADTWVVESFESLPPGFGGVAVTRSGRVWAAAAREVRQAPALGEERVLAERNRRERLIRESQSAASAELAARAAVERAGGEYRSAEADRERAAAEHRARTLERDEAAEEVRRIESSIARRRAAPDDGPKEALRRQLIYDLASKRTEIERMALQRAQRESQLTRLKERSQSDEALRPVVVALAAALQTAQEGIRIKHAEFEAALAADREAGEHVAAELRACAREEASLQSTLHGSSEALTEAEVRLERSRDRATECGQELAQIAERLGLEA
jgi:chromosome segregation protein